MSVSVTNMFAAAAGQAVVDALRQNEVSELVVELRDLIQGNYALGGMSYGFMFQGHFYTTMLKDHMRNAVKKPIHPELVSAANAYVERRTQLNKDMTRIGSGLSLLLRPCKDWQDVRDALPDAMKEEVNNLTGLPRTRPEAWTLKDQPLLLHQYELTSELIFMYIAKRFLV